MGRLLMAFALVAGVLAGAAAQAGAQTVGDVETRDRLIADQENLLNAYRCLFDTDAALVPGGCGDPDEIAPGPAPPAPTQSDIEARDNLIAAQEKLLNTYRCQFDVDTELVSDGCPDDDATPASLGPVPPLAEPHAEFLRLEGLERDCGWWTGRGYTECEYPNGRLNLVDQIKISRGYSELFGCDTGYRMAYCLRRTNPGADTWRMRVELAEYQEACGYGRGRYWLDFNYWECYNDPLDPSAPARPEHNAEVIRLGSEAYDCEFQVLVDNHNFCKSLWGLGGSVMLRIADDLFCQNGWLFKADHSVEGRPLYCYHPDHPDAPLRR